MGKKVLICMDWYLPGYRSGGPVTSVKNMVAALQGDYDFYVLTTNQDYKDDQPYELPVNSWIQREDCQVKYCDHQALMNGAVKQTIAELSPDAVMVNGIYSKYFCRDVIKHAKKQGVRKIIVSPRGMLSPGSLSVKGFKKKQYLRLVKATGMFEDVYFHATGEMEREDIRKHFPDARIAVAPNLPAVLPSEKPVYTGLEGGLRFVTIARVAKEKNTLLAVEAMQEMRGPVALNWYGPTYDEPYLNDCRKVVNELKHVEVNFAGSISPEEIPARFAEAHVFYLPTTGENFGHSILEALMHGLPVLISNKTPWNAVQDAGAGWVVEPGHEELSRVLKDIEAMSYEELKEMSENAYNFASEYLASSKAEEASKAMFDA